MIACAAVAAVQRCSRHGAACCSLSMVCLRKKTSRGLISAAIFQVGIGDRGGGWRCGALPASPSCQVSGERGTRWQHCVQPMHSHFRFSRTFVPCRVWDYSAVRPCTADSETLPSMHVAHGGQGAGCTRRRRREQCQACMHPDVHTHYVEDSSPRRTRGRAQTLSGHSTYGRVRPH